MKPLSSSPQMGKEKYPSHQISEKRFAAVLYCVYDKVIVAAAKDDTPVYPTSFFLEVKFCHKIFDITDYSGKKYWELASDCIGPAGKIKDVVAFMEKVRWDNKAKDTDMYVTKPYPIYPLHSYMKEVDVNVRFCGLDNNGEAVWKVIL